MPDYRNIHTEIWSDPWFELQPPQAKLLFIYLFSNARSTLAGLYEISIRQIGFDTGLDEDDILDAFGRFTEARKAYYDDGMVWVPKMPERNASNLASPKILANIENTLRKARDCALTRQAIRYFNDIIAPRYGIHIIDIPYLQSINHIISEQNNHGGAGAPGEDSEPIESSSQNGNGPTTFAEWQELIRDSKNRPADLVGMYSKLYPGRDPPAFGYMGKIAREVGGAGRMAELLWQHSTRPPTGDVLSYVRQVAKGGSKRARHSDSDQIVLQGGYIPHAADPSEFEDAPG